MLRLLLLAIWASATPVVAQVQSHLSRPPAEARVTTIDHGAYNPSISPDGSTIAIGLLGDIWLVPLAGGEAQPLSSGEGWDAHPTWSPDGRTLAYVHQTIAATEIRHYAFATGTSRSLYGRTPEAYGRYLFPTGKMAFHPSNGRLYYVDFRDGIWSVDASESTLTEPELLFPGSGRRPGRPGITDLSSFAFSPDGQQIVVERDTTSLWTNFYVSPLETPGLRRLTDDAPVRRTNLNWSSDGRALVYLEQAGGREHVVVTDSDGAELRRFDLGPFNGRELALHPDGARAVVVSDRRLAIVDLSNGDVTPIPFEATVRLPPRALEDLVITNARLFDGTSSEVTEGVTVEVRNGVIESVGTGSFMGNANTRVIDARGRFLMPGLVNAHAHLSPNDQLYLAGTPRMGITSVLDLGSSLPHTLNMRDAIDLGVLRGPHVYTSGPSIDGPDGRARYTSVPNIADPVAARELVAEFVRAGVDAIKLYAWLAPEEVAVAVEVAHAAGLPAVGDLEAMTWAAALETGIDGLAHLMDFKWKFLTDYEPNPANPPSPSNFGPLVLPDREWMDALFADAATRGVVFDPTAAAASRYYDADEFAQALETANARDWEGVDLDLDEHPERRALVVAEVLRALHRNGVRWVAGTDAGQSLLFDELRIYEIAGIPNDVVLRAATSNVAALLGRNDFGTVEAGRRADLILVDGDPMERIGDLEKVVLVVQGGRVVKDAWR